MNYSMIYYLGMFSIAVFAITGVIATKEKELDLFSIVFLGLVTALGGGTIRDIILGSYPVFWISDPMFLWTALIASLVSFGGGRYFSNLYSMFLYLDALGIALFSIVATQKTMSLGHPPYIAVIMGVITAIFGSILRDILTGRPTLLLSKELYATPVLIGTILYVGLDYMTHHSLFVIPLCIVFIFLFRSVAIRFNITYPSWLCFKK